MLPSREWLECVEGCCMFMFLFSKDVNWKIARFEPLDMILWSGSKILKENGIISTCRLCLLFSAASMTKVLLALRFGDAHIDSEAPKILESARATDVISHIFTKFHDLDTYNFITYSIIHSYIRNLYRFIYNRCILNMLIVSRCFEQEVANRSWLLQSKLQKRLVVSWPAMDFPKRSEIPGTSSCMSSS